ncbi:hypothetical protein [Streptomyces sp. NPDC051577]|uniref:hypothetical protein n=1 Tax=Streptomyces sp. NPDC051577 TaxID=3155166 RepID=UPI0034463E37
MACRRDQGCRRIGSLSTDLVAIEARKALEGTDAEDAELLAGLDEAVADGSTAKQSRTAPRP